MCIREQGLIEMVICADEHRYAEYTCPDMVKGGRIQSSSS